MPLLLRAPHLSFTFPLLLPEGKGPLVQAYRRCRLRFDDFTLERFPDGRCKTLVRLEWTRNRRYEGEAEGTQTLEGEIRAAASAALSAVASATGGELAFELRGVKAIRVFDTWMVVVSTRAQFDGETRRLMGSYPCPDENKARGAVIAALDATNRILEPYLQE